jgi:UDP-N-acetyl-L-fucosamine synthase
MTFLKKINLIHISIKLISMIKIITVVGTRPEIIRLSSIIKKLEYNFNHILINTNQNYNKNLNSIFFKNFNIKKPKYNLNTKSKTTIETVSKIINKVDKIIEKEKPDAFLVLGDTNSCLSSYSAKRRKVPIFHLEAGNRCFDENVPEEINRKIVDNISDINLTYSLNSKLNLLNEGFKIDTLFEVGSPLYEVIKGNLKKIEKSNILNKLMITKKKYILVSIHREENVDDEKKLHQIFNILSAVVTKTRCKIIFTLHPRTKKMISKSKIKPHKDIKFFSPFSFFDYCFLQKNSKFVISDSGSISEESVILNFPAINLRTSHERSEAMDGGAVIMTGINQKSVMQSIKIMESQFFLGPNDRNIRVKSYEQSNVSDKVVGIINSYYHSIKKNKWFDNYK